MLLELEGHLLRRFGVLHDGAHLDLHLLEVVDKFVFSSVLHLADLLADLLLKRSLTLRPDRLQFTVDYHEGCL